MCQKQKQRIPEDQNLFGPMIGEWDIEWADHLENIPERCVKGEWIFSDITPDSFRWRKMGMDNSGDWKTDAQVSAKRKTESSDR